MNYTYPPFEQSQLYGGDLSLDMHERVDSSFDDNAIYFRDGDLQDAMEVSLSQSPSHVSNQSLEEEDVSMSTSFINWEEETAKTVLQGKSGVRKCPSCKSMISTRSRSMHDHITSCFLQSCASNNSKSTPSKPTNQNQCNSVGPGTKPHEANVYSVRQTISKLDIRTRLGVMESFYRLSKSQSLGESFHGAFSPSGFSKAETDDHSVLNLVYGDLSDADVQSLSIIPKPTPMKQKPSSRFNDVVLPDLDLLSQSLGEDHEMILSPFSPTQTSFSFADALHSEAL